MATSRTLSHAPRSSAARRPWSQRFAAAFSVLALCRDASLRARGCTGGVGRPGTHAVARRPRRRRSSASPTASRSSSACGSRSDVDGYVTGVRYYKARGRHRHSRRPPVDRRRHAARRGDVHGRDRRRAGSRSTSSAGRDHAPASPTWRRTSSPEGYFSDTPRTTSRAAATTTRRCTRPAIPTACTATGARASRPTAHTYNYWVDVAVVDQTGADTTPPTVTQTVPVAGATDVAPSTTVSVKFDEALDPATVEHDDGRAPCRRRTGGRRDGRVQRGHPYRHHRSATLPEPLDRVPRRRCRRHRRRGQRARGCVHVHVHDRGTGGAAGRQRPGGPILVVADAGDAFGATTARSCGPKGSTNIS